MSMFGGISQIPRDQVAELRGPVGPIAQKSCGRADARAGDRHRIAGEVGQIGPIPRPRPSRLDNLGSNLSGRSGFWPVGMEKDEEDEVWDAFDRWKRQPVIYANITGAWA